MGQSSSHEQHPQQHQQNSRPAHDGVAVPPLQSSDKQHAETGKAVHFASQPEVYMRTGSSAWESSNSMSSTALWCGGGSQAGRPGGTTRSLPSQLPALSEERQRPPTTAALGTVEMPSAPPVCSLMGVPSMGHQTNGMTEVARTPAEMHNTLRLRSAWQVGSVVEVFSASLGRWCVAMVTQVSQNQFLSVSFADAKGELLSKMLARSDLQLACFGSNIAELPPGFKAVPSQSRPGECSYLDVAKGIKYQTLELAWRAHIERLIDPKVDPKSYADPGPLPATTLQAGACPNLGRYPSLDSATQGWDTLLKTSSLPRGISSGG